MALVLLFTASEQDPTCESRLCQGERAPPPVDYALPDAERTWVDYAAPFVAVPTVNLLFWLPSRYLLDNDYSRINGDTVRANFDHGWVFDEDGFTINQFGHPYQGSMYFNAARSFGLSFWESAPYVAMGSLMWEYTMESGPVCCFPSINDFITTTVGGIAVGEVMWRLSNFVLDDTSTGGERALREVGALAINPPYGLYRLLSGEAYARGAAPLRPHALWGEVSLGGSLFGSGAEPSDFAWIPRLRLRQGRARDLAPGFAPFDHFSLDLALGISGDEIVGTTFDVAGLLGGTQLNAGGGDVVLGAAIDFEYFENVLANLGQSSLGAAILGEWPIADRWLLFGRLMALGGFASIKSNYEDIRRYNMGLAAVAKLWLELRHAEGIELYVKADRYWVRTSSGWAGDERAGVLDVGAAWTLHGPWSVGAHVLYADKTGFYRRLADTSETIVLGEGYVAWKF